MLSSAREIYIAVVGSAVIMILLVGVIILAIVRYQSRLRKYTQQMNDLKNAYQQEILKAQLEIREQTLHTISQEIHDNLGQILSLVKLNLMTLEVEAGSESEQKLHDSRTFLSQAITDLRNLSKILNTNLISHVQLSSSLQLEIDRLRKTGMYETDLQVIGFEKTIDPQKSLILFRMAQEVLNNTIKHAQATRIGIQLLFTEVALTLTLTDNGVGFEQPHTTEATLPQTGNGLGNLYSRAHLIGADLQVHSSPGKGTQVCIRLTNE